MKNINNVYILLTFISVFIFSSAYAGSPRERISFWRDNFATLTAREHPQVEKAHLIFKKLVNIAGNRNGSNPMLHIVSDAPDNIPLPMAIPDGWIIISKSTLDFAYKEPSNGDNVLAFILAHELSHQLEDDFWHMKFFQALDNSKYHKNSKQLLEIQRILSQSDKMKAKELRADEQGITIATMAGFDTLRILEYENKNNFFTSWINRFSSLNYDANKKSDTHPTPAQRELAIYSRLKQIQHQSSLFSLGLWLYQAGQYKTAKDAFEEFRHYFPGKAVNHNIALCYHKLALQAIPPTNHHKFRTTVSLDPYTYASQVDRSYRVPLDNHDELLSKAIEFYELSISQDKHYISAYINLSSAYLQKNKAYKAIGLLQDAIKIQPDNSKLLNNLAVAFYKVERKDKTRKILLQALSLDNNGADILYNLGFLHLLQNEASKTNFYWQQFLKLEPHSGWSKQVYYSLNKTYKPVNSTFVKAEAVKNIQIGHYLDEIPANWTLKESYLLTLNNNTYNLSRFENGISSITEENEIVYLVAENTFHGNTNNGISINDTSNSLISKYGAPDEVQHFTNGINMIYRNLGISFHVTNNRIKSWLLFRS